MVERDDAHVAVVNGDVPNDVREDEAEECADGADVGAIWKMLDLITPMAIRVVGTLRIADLIQQGHGQLDELAARAGTDRDALGRLLRYLTARGLFREPSTDRFALNPLARLLLDAHPSATRGWIDLDGFGGRMDLAFFDLFATIRDGRPPVVCDDSALPPAIAASYDTVMEAQSKLQAPGIAAGIDWSGARIIADIGGGTGTLLAACLRAQPEARGLLLDLPATVDRATQTLANEGVGDRCELIGGNFFEVMAHGADVYLLKLILHFLEDEPAVTLLRRCRAAGHAASRLVVIERSIGPGDDRGQFTSMDLRMLILGQGRERTLEEYAALAARAGLHVVSTPKTAAGMHLIEMR